MTTLNEARQAAQQLNDLQQKAALLPELEQREARSESQRQLESLRVRTLEENKALYQTYIDTYRNYQEAFSVIVEILQEASNIFKELQSIKKQILNNARKYSDSWALNQYQFNGAKRETLAFESESRLDDTLPGKLNLDLVPQRKNPIFSALLNLIMRI